MKLLSLSTNAAPSTFRAPLLVKVAPLFILTAACGGAEPGATPTEAVAEPSTEQATIDAKACAGAQVPGDYATIQDAVNALEAASGGTICLKGQQYDESVTIDTGKSVTLQGSGRGATTISGSLSIYASPGTFTATKLNVTGPTIAQGNVALSYVTLRTTSSSPALEVTGQACFECQYVTVVTLDGVDVAGSSSVAAIIEEAADVDDPASVTLTVKNSWVHDSSFGIQQTPSGTSSTTLSLVNSTFEGDATAVYSGSGLDYYNNIFSDNGVAVDIAGGSSLFSNNAYHGNTTNFAGDAVEGAHDVKSALKLTKAKPPSLDASSPCRGAALASVAPPTDYSGNTRDPKAVDLGAVQASK